MHVRRTGRIQEGNIIRLDGPPLAASASPVVVTIEVNEAWAPNGPLAPSERSGLLEKLCGSAVGLPSTDAISARKREEIALEERRG